MCGPHLLRHEPSRRIGGEPKRSEDSLPRFCSYGRGQTASRQAARRVNLPSGGRFSNITEDVRKYAAEQGGRLQMKIKQWVERFLFNPTGGILS